MHPNLKAQDDNLEFKVYGFEEGLSHRNVFKIQQDSLGYIWIATFKGLNRFDGRDFIVYQKEETENILLDDFVEDLVISKDTMIWMAGNEFISVLDPFNNKIEKITLEPGSVAKDRKLKALGLYVDFNNRVWGAGYNLENGQSHLHVVNDENQMQDIMPFEGSFMSRAIIGLDGNVLVSYAENVLRELNPRGEWVKDYALKSNDEQAKSWITQLQITNDKTIWALLNNGLIFNKKNNTSVFKQHRISKFIAKNNINYNGFLVEENGDVWVAGMSSLWHFSGKDSSIYNYNNEIKEITKNTCNFRQVIKDKSGVIWVASDYGAIKVTKSNKLFSNILSDGSENCNDGVCSTRGITGDDQGNIYISYYNSIHVVNTEKKLARPLFQRKRFNNPPFGLLHHDNALWTGNGLRIDLKTLQVEKLFETKSSEGVVIVDHENMIWFANDNVIQVYNSQTREIDKFIDPSGILDSIKHITYLSQGKADNTIWVGTKGNGVFHLDKERGIVANYSADPLSTPKISHNRILAFEEDDNGILWIASELGLNKLDLVNGRNRIYTTDYGLANNFVNGLLIENENYLWLSTDNGLSRLDIKKQRFDNFTIQDGLSKNEFNRISFYRAKDGKMYFGGLNGVNAFYPDGKFQEKRRSRRDKLLLTSFSKLDVLYDSMITKTTGLNSENTIEILPNDRFFTFKFALANYNNPLQNLYSYKLDGFETEWSRPTTISEARYNSIPPGNYTFRVRSAASDGSWSEDQLAVNVKIKEAFTKSWLFLLLCFVALSMLLYLVQQIRIRRIRQRERLLERIVTKRTQDLQEEKKKSEDLLRNILPIEMAEELKQFGKAKAKRHDTVSVLFTDFKDFSSIAAKLSPEELVAEIDHCYKAFDMIMDKYGLEKIKTIGDSYMCAGGIFSKDDHQANQMVLAALDVQEFMTNLKLEKQQKQQPFFEARLGIHTGPVVAGVVGIRKFAYDIWGDTVNIASRMESSGEVGRVNISQDTYELVRDRFHCIPRGKIEVKSVGEVDLYFVEGKI